MTSELPPEDDPRPEPRDPAVAEPSGPEPPRPEPSRTEPPQPPGATPTAAPAIAAARTSGGDFWDRLRGLGVARPAQGRWVGGVAAGLARRWGVDPLLVRGLFVVVTIVGGLGLLIYGLAWLLLPEDDGRIHAQEALHGHITGGLVGSVLLILIDLGNGGHGAGPWGTAGLVGWGFPGGLVITALAGVGIWWWLSSTGRIRRGLAGPGMTPTTATAAGPHYGPAAFATGSGAAPGATGSAPTTGGGSGGTDLPPYGSPSYGTPPAGGYGYGTGVYDRPGPGGPAQLSVRVPPQPRPHRPDPAQPSHRLTRGVLGLALLAAAAMVLVDLLGGSFGAPTGLIAALAALTVIGAGVVAAGLSGRRSGGLAPIGLLLTAGVLIGAAAASSVQIDNRAHLSVLGDRHWRPSTAEQAGQEWTVGIGNATLDLTNPAVRAGATGTDPLRVTARVGLGDLTVVVPDGVPVSVEARGGDGRLSTPAGSEAYGGQGSNDPQGDHRATAQFGPSGSAVIRLTTEIGAGDVTVRTASGATTPAPAPNPAPSQTLHAAGSAAAVEGVLR